MSIDAAQVGNTSSYVLKDSMDLKSLISLSLRRRPSGVASASFGRIVHRRRDLASMHGDNEAGGET